MSVTAAMVGLGVHARRGHIDHFAASGIDLVAVCDASREALDSFAAAYPGNGCGLHTDYAEMLDRGGFEAVFVMTPDRFHADQTLAALERGLHVFCEKPMADDARSLATLHRAMEVAEARGLALSTCHPRRFDRPFLRLKEALPGLVDRFGPLLEFRFDFSYYAPTRHGLHHGLLIDHFSHEIDLVHFLFGHSPFTAYRLHDDPVRYHAAGVREDGLAFAFGGTRMLEESVYPEFAFLRFARGELRLDTGTGIAMARDHTTGGAFETAYGKTDYDGRFRAVNADFARAVRGEGRGYLTRHDLWVNTQSSVALTHNGREYHSPSAP